MIRIPLFALVAAGFSLRAAAQTIMPLPGVPLDGQPLWYDGHLHVALQDKNFNIGFYDVTAGTNVFVPDIVNPTTNGSTGIRLLGSTESWFFPRADGVVRAWARRKTAVPPLTLGSEYLEFIGGSNTVWKHVGNGVLDAKIIDGKLMAVYAGGTKTTNCQAALILNVEGVEHPLLVPCGINSTMNVQLYVRLAKGPDKNIWLTIYRDSNQYLETVTVDPVTYQMNGFSSYDINGEFPSVRTTSTSSNLLVATFMGQDCLCPPPGIPSGSPYDIQPMLMYYDGTNETAIAYVLADDAANDTAPVYMAKNGADDALDLCSVWNTASGRYDLLKLWQVRGGEFKELYRETNVPVQYYPTVTGPKGLLWTNGITYLVRTDGNTNAAVIAIADSVVTNIPSPPPTNILCNVTVTNTFIRTITVTNAVTVTLTNSVQSGCSNYVIKTAVCSGKCRLSYTSKTVKVCP